MTYQLFDKATAKYSEPVSMQTKYFDCQCTPESIDPKCHNTRTDYVIDFVDGKLVRLKECPRRFDDSELWRGLYVACYRLKDMDRCLPFYGIPEAFVVEPVYQLLELMLQARERYQAQKAHMESL